MPHYTYLIHKINDTYSSLAEFQNNVNVSIILKKSVESNDVLVIETLVNVNFLNDFFPGVVLQEQLFRDHFSRKHFVRLHVRYLVAFCESTLRKIEIRVMTANGRNLKSHEFAVKGACLPCRRIGRADK